MTTVARANSARPCSRAKSSYSTRVIWTSAISWTWTGGASAARTYYVADITGQAILHVLYEQLMRHHLSVDRFGLIGYSLGGRVALHFALAAWEQMWGIVIESASSPISPTRIETLVELAVSRSVVWAELRRDGTIATWRPVAKDGAALPASAYKVNKPSRAAFIPTGTGQTRIGWPSSTARTRCCAMRSTTTRSRRWT